MKYRKDFVTNSSSSSFIIAKKHLDEDQLKAIRHHGDMGLLLDIRRSIERWSIVENEEYISGYTSMDNFNIGTLFSVIGIPDRVVKWDESPFDLEFDCIEDANDEDIEYWRKMVRKL